uniref:L1 transposable element RRM domain-containing protein n=1 Tax=Latimeria chalumnae TaxID=7897 RepID=H3AZS0_LATCH
INKSMSDINDKLDNADTRLDEVESRVVKLEDQEEQSGRVAEHGPVLRILSNWSQRNNVCLMGLPEETEKGRPVEFLQDFLPKYARSTKLETERAHRLLAPCPESNQRPRLIIMHLLKFQTRELLLRKAREKQTLNWEGNHLALFQDLPKEVQLKRQTFLEGKKILKEKGIKYNMTYPAALHIQYEGTQEHFAIPEALKDFIS